MTTTDFCLPLNHAVLTTPVQVHRKGFDAVAVSSWMRPPESPNSDMVCVAASDCHWAVRPSDLPPSKLAIDAGCTLHVSPRQMADMSWLRVSVYDSRLLNQPLAPYVMLAISGEGLMARPAARGLSVCFGRMG